MSATTSATTEGENVAAPCRVLPLPIEGARAKSLLDNGPLSAHNAGVGSSSLPPATRESVLSQWLRRFSAFLSARCATTSATTLYQNSVVVPSIYDQPLRLLGPIWRWIA
jgi:hypothetical protein